MLKKTINIFFIIIPVLFFVLAFSQNALAAAQDVNYPWSETASPGEFVNNFYRFALGIAGVAAFGVIIYGAILYTTSAGNPSKQQDAKSWIMGAIWGVVLLLAAYLILYTINPNLVDLTSPTLKKIEKIDVSSVQSQQEESIRQSLLIKFIHVKDGVSLIGTRQETLNEIISLSEKVSNITITAGTDGDHASGDKSHYTGYKVDLRIQPTLDRYIEDNFKFVGLRDGDKAKQYKSPSSGAIYARESNHWDVLVQ